MRLGEPGKVNSSINVTPLVDVVLCLLIIFMVMAPEMRKGPDVKLPDTQTPVSQGDERSQILVSIDESGQLWIDDKRVDVDKFDAALRAAVGNQTEPKVVIRGDARLQFSEVRGAMIAVQQAGFPGVRLISKKAGKSGGGD